MSSDTTTEQLHVTAGFEIKLPNPEDVSYAHYNASIFVPIAVPDGADADEVEALANQALGIAQRSAAEALGIESETTVSEAGVERVKLQLEKALGGAVKSESKSSGGNRSSGGRKPSGSKPKGGGGRGPNKTQVGAVTVLNQIDADLPDWLEDRWLELVEDGKIDESDNEVWDNRKWHPEFGGDGNPNAPWFKTGAAKEALDFGGEWK